MNSRKRKTEIIWDKIIVKIVSVLILLLIIVLAVSWSSRTAQVGQLKEENASLRQEVEEWESHFGLEQTMAENNENSGDTMAQDITGPKTIAPEITAPETTNPETTAPETTDPDTTAPDTTAPDTTAPDTTATETTPPETEPEKLQTLDGVAAGTEVSSSELDTEHMSKYFQAYEIKTTGACYKRINGQSYRENPNVQLDDLRYLKVLHYNFNHQIQVGEIIVNKGLAEDVLSIFRELYDAEYEIQSMYLVDNYWTGDGVESDSASIDENNTSAFNYRPAVGSGKLSNHAYGFAIDINPQQNPYVSYSSGQAKWSHKNANDYIDRDTGLPHVITHEDTAFKIFKAHGFKWGGDWNNPKDYQHFEKKLY